MEERDLIILGGGPAGLTAGIYGVRSELKALIIEATAPGGQIATAGIVENYPGFPEGIMGIDLAENMRKQAENAGVEIRSYERVTGLKKVNDLCVVTTAKGEYMAPAVIIATGLEHKKLGIPGEKAYNGKGVSYCFTCDGPLYKGKDVVVIGSGTGAVEAAVFLDDIASKVTQITKSDSIRAAEAILKKRLERSGVKIRLKTHPLEIVGDEVVKGLKVFDFSKDKEDFIAASGIFVEIGMRPNTSFLEGTGIEMQNGFIVVDENMRTNIPGLYAAGDVVAGSLFQLGISVAQGTIAALDAYKYLKSR